jgi:hypothetical protein
VDDAIRTLSLGMPSPDIVRLAAGLRDAIAVLGEDKLDSYRRGLVYTDAVALAEVRARAGRLLPVSTLFSLTWARGDLISYARRVSQVMLDAVALLAAANREFVPVEEPKWIPWQLARLSRQPQGLANLLSDLFRSPSLENAYFGDAVLLEVLNLVDDAVPDADTRSARFALGLAAPG